jgi:hypothetical protein
VDIDDHEELIVCAEIVDRVVKQHNIEPRFVEISIRRAIFAEESLTVRDVVLLRPGAIPKTSSGKVQRNKTKGLYVGGSLARY